MKVTLLHNTPLDICSTAIRTCWDSHAKSDNGGEKDLNLIARIGNKMKHESVKNHVNYTFNIEGITTKTLLALTRHDIGTEFSVQSTRYTTSKSVNNGTASYTKSKNDVVNGYLANIADMVVDCVEKGLSNDDISMLLPQAWNYNLVCTMSMTAAQHFIKLRTTSHAHYDIQELANLLFDSLPESHKYLFDDCVCNSEQTK